MVEWGGKRFFKQLAGDIETRDDEWWVESIVLSFANGGLARSRFVFHV